LDLEVFHITEYLYQLIKGGKIKLTKAIPMVVTYHDPCHLGRMGEPYAPWEGVEKKVLNQVYIYDPPSHGGGEQKGFMILPGMCSGAFLV